MRGRAVLLTAVVGGGLLVILGAGSLVRVPPDRVAVAGGRVLGPGLHLVRPFAARVQAPIASEPSLSVPVETTGGGRMAVDLRLRARVDPDRLDGRALAAAGTFDALVAGRAGAALGRALQDRPEGDPLAAEAREAARAAIVLALDAAGVQAEEVQVEGGDDPAWRSFRERRIRALAREPGRKVMWIGLDGADWQLIDPLLRQGRMPALASLLRRGARADLRSNEPMLSPLLWTTVATGKSPDEHGIVDFLLVDPASGGRVPMSSRFRRTKAMWNILTDLDRPSAFVAWWATWPAERVDGTMVTDRVAYTLFAGIVPEAGRGSAGLTFPPGYIGEVSGDLVEPSQIRDGEIRRFLRLPAAEIQEGREKLQGSAGNPPEHPVVALARVLAAARTYQGIALDLLRRGQPELMAVYYEGIDQIGHRFMHYAPPRMEMVSDREFARYQNAVAEYYVYQDELLGQLIAAADPSTVFLVLSDHGFKNGGGRPRDVAPYVSEKPGFWHRRYGIFVLAGPGVRRGRIDTVSLYDVLPTTLELLGLPVPEDMRGRVLAEALDRQEPVVRIATYEGIGERSQAPTSTEGSSAIEAEMVRELTALGYLSPGAADTPEAGSGAVAEEADAETTASYHLNLAAILAGQERWADAEREVRAGLAKAEIPDGYRILSEVLERQGNREGAIDALRRSLEVAARSGKAPGMRGPGDAGRLRLIGLLLDAGRVDEAAAVAAAPFASPAMQATGRGLIAERAGNREEAVRLYRGVLGSEPTLVAAMVRLYPLTPAAQLDGLEPIVRRGLEENDQLAPYHNVLGVILRNRGDLAGAITEYGRALDLDPDNVEYLANLGNAEMIRGRLDRALELLERARDREPDNPEVWLRIGTVHGKAGRPKESLEALDRAAALGAQGPGLAVGRALAYLQLGNEAAARRVVAEARAAHPADPTLRELADALPPAP